MKVQSATGRQLVLLRCRPASLRQKRRCPCAPYTAAALATAADVVVDHTGSRQLQHVPRQPAISEAPRHSHAVSTAATASAGPAGTPEQQQHVTGSRPRQQQRHREGAGTQGSSGAYAKADRVARQGSHTSSSSSSSSSSSPNLGHGPDSRSQRPHTAPAHNGSGRQEAAGIRHPRARRNNSNGTAPTKPGGSWPKTPPPYSGVHNPGGTSEGSPPTPQQLTSMLLQTTSVQALHARLTQHADSASGICAAAAITHLAKLMSGTRGGSGSGHRSSDARGSPSGSSAYSASRSDDKRRGQGKVQGRGDDGEGPTSWATQGSESGDDRSDSSRGSSGSGQAVDSAPQGRGQGGDASGRTAELQTAAEALRLAMQLMQPHLPELPARGYANCIWACAKLAVAISGTSAATAAANAPTPASSSSGIPTPPSSSSSASLKGAARRQSFEGDGQDYDWSSDVAKKQSLAALCGVAVRCLAEAFVHNGRARTANTQDLANTCYGLALLGLGPHRMWHDALLPRAAQLAPSFQPHALSNVFWALGRLQLRPQEPILEVLVLQAKKLLASKLKPERGGRVHTSVGSVGGVGTAAGGGSSDDDCCDEGEAQLRLLPRPQVKGQSPAEGAAAHAGSTSAMTRDGNGGAASLSGEQRAGGSAGEAASSRGEEATGQQPRASSSPGIMREGGNGGSDPRAGGKDGKHVEVGRQSEPAMPQFVSNVTWALARLQYNERSYFKQVERSIKGIAEQANSQNLSNLLWAFACLDIPSPTLFAALLPRVKLLAQQNRLSMQSISNIAWACAKAGAYEPELFDELAKCATPQLHRFNSQDMCNMAWAYGMTSHRDKRLFAALVRAALPCAPRMGPQELSQLFWSMATLNFASESLCSCVSKLAPAKILPSQAAGVGRGGAEVGEGGGGGGGSGGAAGLGSDAAVAATAATGAATGAHGGQQWQQHGKSIGGAEGSGTDSSLTGGWQMQPVCNVAWAWAIMRPGDTGMLRALFAQADTLLQGATPPQFPLTRRRSKAEGRDRAGSGGDSEGSGEEEGVAGAGGQGSGSDDEVELEPDVRHARQLFQAHMAHQLACMSGQASPPGAAPAEMSPRTLAYCRAAWKGLVSEVLSSRKQLAVLEVLRSMGHHCSSEQVLGHGLFCVDILLKHKVTKRAIVVEVDGPFHYAKNDPTKPLGELLLRNRFIRALGHSLVCIPYYEWQTLATDQQRRQYLEAKLSAAMPSPEAKAQLAESAEVAARWVRKVAKVEVRGAVRARSHHHQGHGNSHSYNNGHGNSHSHGNGHSSHGRDDSSGNSHSHGHGHTNGHRNSLGHGNGRNHHQGGRSKVVLPGTGKARPLQEHKHTHASSGPGHEQVQQQEPQLKEEGVGSEQGYVGVRPKGPGPAAGRRGSQAPRRPKHRLQPASQQQRELEGGSDSSSEIVSDSVPRKRGTECSYG